MTLVFRRGCGRPPGRQAAAGPAGQEGDVAQGAALPGVGRDHEFPLVVFRALVVGNIFQGDRLLTAVAVKVRAETPGQVRRAIRLIGPWLRWIADSQGRRKTGAVDRHAQAVRGRDLRPSPPLAVDDDPESRPGAGPRGIGGKKRREESLRALASSWSRMRLRMAAPGDAAGNFTSRQVVKTREGVNAVLLALACAADFGRKMDALRREGMKCGLGRSAGLWRHSAMRQRHEHRFKSARETILEALRK